MQNQNKPPWYLQQGIKANKFIFWFVLKLNFRWQVIPHTLKNLEKSNVVADLKGLGIKEMKAHINDVNTHLKPGDDMHRNVGMFGKMKVSGFKPNCLGKVYCLFTFPKTA